MQTLLGIWRLLSMLGFLVVPQLLGVLAYFTIRKYGHLLAHLVGFLLPPVLFFFLAQIMLSATVQEIQSDGERVCGTFVGMMAMAILFGTGVQVLLSLLAQFVLYTRSRPAQSQV